MPFWFFSPPRAQRQRRWNRPGTWQHRRGSICPFWSRLWWAGKWLLGKLQMWIHPSNSSNTHRGSNRKSLSIHCICNCKKPLDPRNWPWTHRHFIRGGMILGNSPTQLVYWKIRRCFAWSCPALATQSNWSTCHVPVDRTGTMWLSLVTFYYLCSNACFHHR